MAKGRGGGKTPARVVELLNMEVAEKGQSAVSRETGLTRQTVQRYLVGIGEPSTATLKKLADYFKVPVNWLRGEADAKSTIWDATSDSGLHLKLLSELVELHSLIPGKYKFLIDYLTQLLIIDTSEIMTFHGPNIDKDTEEKMNRLILQLDKLKTLEWEK